MTKTEFIDWLRSKGACAEALEWAATQESVESILATDRVDWLEWLVKKIGGPLDDAYEAQRKPLWDAYQAQRKPLSDAYQAQVKQLSDAYWAQVKPLYDAYEAQRKPLLDAYNAQRLALLRSLLTVLIS